MSGQWRRQTKGQQQTGTGSNAPQIVASVFDAVKLVGANPSGTPDANTLYKGLIPKAWIRFNMATDAIADSFNVSSITDGAAGADTVNWDRDFVDANYATIGSAGSFGVVAGMLGFHTFAAGSVVLFATSDAGAAFDSVVTTVCAFGDQ